MLYRAWYPCVQTPFPWLVCLRSFANLKVLAGKGDTRDNHSLNDEHKFKEALVDIKEGLTQKAKGSYSGNMLCIIS